MAVITLLNTYSITKNPNRTKKERQTKAMQATASDSDSHFSKTFPLTHERLKRSVARRQNALKAFSTSDKELWQRLMKSHMEAKHSHPQVLPLSSSQENMLVQSASHYDELIVFT